MSPAPLPPPPEAFRASLRRAAQEWDQWLAVWVQEVWPVFQRRGITMGEALTQWHLNDLAVLLQVDDLEADEPWRHQSGDSNDAG